MAEGLIRRLPPFSRFLKSIALANGEMINFTKLANDCQVPPSTVTEYVGILEDTLVGFLLPAWIESKKRKAIRTEKFYFFDPGVTHMLAGTEKLDRNSNLYGKSFEQFICMELRAYLSYTRKKFTLTYWRSKNGHEVDFLIGTRTAIEVKTSQKVSKNDFKGLNYLNEEGVFQNLILVSQDPVSKRDGNILAYPLAKISLRPLERQVCLSYMRRHQSLLASLLTSLRAEYQLSRLASRPPRGRPS